jgi:hypothetical protein
VVKEGSLRLGVNVEQSESPMSSPNRQACGESREGRGGGGHLDAARRKENGRERPQARLLAERGEGCGRQWPPAIGRGWGRCCVNRGERRSAGDEALHD